MKTTDILKTIAKISVLAIILKALGLDPELTFKYKVDECQTSGSAS